MTLAISILFLMGAPLVVGDYVFAAIPVAAAALPLLLLRLGRWFWVSSIGGALVLYGAGFLGALFGLWAYWLPAVLLLAAAGSPGERRLRLRRVIGVATGVIGGLALLLGGLAMYANVTTPYTAYRARLVSPLSIEEYQRLQDRVMHLPDVDGVSGSFPPDVEITVWFGDGLSEQERDVLGRRLIDLPQIREVELCRC
ncbi:MAG: hypothetical protein ACRDHS_03185 [Actinomycetota bacterium]